MLLELIQNIALLVTLAVGLQALARWLGQGSRVFRWAAGGLFGAIGVVGMLMPMRLGPGVFYDGRSIILSLAGVFAGPEAAAVAALVCGAFRVHVGGDGMLPGVATILSSAGLGVVYHTLRRRSRAWDGPLRLWGFAVVVHAAMLASQLLLPQGGWGVVERIGLPVLILYPITFVLIAQMFLEGQRRWSMQQTLRRRDEVLNRSQAIAHVGSWQLDLKSGTLSWSDETFRIFGLRPQSIQPSYEAFLDLTHPDDRKAVDEAYQASLREERPTYSIEHRIVRPSTGEVRLVEERCEHIRNAAGAVIRSVGMVQDVTDRKRLENELVQAQKMQAVGRLAGGVAHDFNNMLQTILGYTEILLEQADAQHPFHEDLQEIQRAARRSADLTRQLLAFARKQVITPQTLDLNQAVASTLKMLQRLIGEQVELVWTPQEPLWAVRMDPVQVDQILANLVVNARDAIDGVGSIHIQTSTCSRLEGPDAPPGDLPAGDCTLLTVTDTGRGMDRQTLAQLFEPFFTTRGDDGGTGLGLATVYGIVRQNGGAIEIDSAPGQGTTVRIYLPRDLAPLTQAEGPRESIVTGSGTVLLVEDEPSLLELARQMLTRLGYTVLAAGDAATALRIAAENQGPIDLLLTDVVMPRMSGRELRSRIESLRPGIACLYMSGYTANVMASQGVLEEGVHFLQKPFDAAALARKVREAMAAGQLPSASTPAARP